MSSAPASPSPTASSSSVPAAQPDWSSHLSYPSPEPIASTSESTHEQRPRSIHRERLYVGNLHPSIDEYTLLQVFSKFGKLAKLDFLFHKSGPLKGKPRGYAFVEFADANDAQKALELTNDKLLRGRKLVVTHAHQAPLDQAGYAGARPRRFMNDAGKPTTLSLLKNASAGRSDLTENKIARMEAKLRQMEQSSVDSGAHPSLPSQSIAASVAAVEASTGQRRSVPPKKTRSSLPSLPLTKPSSSPLVSPALSPVPRVDGPKKSTPLLGVRIVKKKDQA